MGQLLLEYTQKGRGAKSKLADHIFRRKTPLPRSQLSADGCMDAEEAEVGAATREPEL